MNKLGHSQLRQRIDEILFYLWDPIGIAHSNWPRHEYHAYVEQALQLTLDHDTQHALQNYLDKIRTEHMHLTSNSEKDERIAKLIFEIKVELMQTL